MIMTGRADHGAELFRSDPRPPDFIEHRRYASYQAWRQLVIGGHIDHERLVGDLLGISRYVHSRYAYAYTIHEVLPEFSRSRLTAALGDVIARLPMESAVRIPVEEAVVRLVAFFGPVPMEWLSDSVLRTVFSGIRPRDVDFAGSTDSLSALDKISVTDTRRLCLVLRDVPDAQLLCTARLMRPDLLEAVHAAFDSTDGAWAVLTYLARDFPPPVDIPTPDSPRILAGLITLAEGKPGDTVSHGLFPSTITKLARLCLASTGHYPPAQVLDAARSAYDRRRPYYAHDAVACALAHPAISAAERADLIRHLSGHDGHGPAARGRRARKKFSRLIRWGSRQR